VNPDNLKEIAKYLPPNPTFYKGKGCAVCNNSGYVGREMISEVLLISEELSTMIANGASKEKMRKQAYSEGFITMLQDGVNKGSQGQGHRVEEVLRSLQG